jgi:hypothetical protein
MTRAALLPTGADPFMLAYWLRNYATWSGFVDELHIMVNGPVEDEARTYIEACVAAAGAKVYYNKKRTDHGRVIAQLLRKTRATHIMLCEDDAYIRRPEIVDECFLIAEVGGIAATPRNGYASNELIAAAAARLGDPYAYWPCFVFSSKESLYATDKRFGGINWSVGERIFERTLTEQAHSDTFVWASWQLRAQGLPETLLDNHRLYGQTLPEDAPWVHVGSLSSGHGFMWMSDIRLDNYRNEIEQFSRLPDGNALQRIGWWWRIWMASDGISDYRARYVKGLTAFRDDLGIGEANVNAYQGVIDRIVTWAE